MHKIAPNLASKPARTPVSTTAPSPSPPPAQPPPPSEPAWLIGPALKAANEHAFATQRAKKAADRAKAKAPPRKAPATGRSSSAAAAAASIAAASSPARGAVPAGTMTSIWAEVWDARKMSADDLDWPELPTPLSSLSQRYWSPSPSPAAECAPLRPTQDREVPLSALVRPIKPRGLKTKEGEFEFLPPVKNVIALDDVDTNVPDEPWEYVSSVGGEDEARKIFSYAEIVSKSA